MSLINMAAQLFISKLGGTGEQLDTGSVVAALQNLLPTDGGELDLNALVGQFTSGGGLADLASSWLGGGDNEAISPSTLIDVLGNDQVSEFAGQLGLGEDTAAEGLAQMIPELIDGNSEGGDLLGGAVGDMAKGVLGKLF
ncbi:YidB family protein [Marinobacterium stanieri]|uniref:YidB family protein n=1 Tax=Marinobacterium stanieri TaxID=49186 RepID=UPI000255924F|nr:YidB family protein [Marinobacterium stanieri]